MPWTGYEAKELRHGEEEVEDLRDEEEQHRFAEVSENRDDCERHSGEIAEGVADKHTRRVPAQK